MPVPGTWEIIWKLIPNSARKMKILDAGCGPMLWDFQNCEIQHCDIIKHDIPNLRIVDLNKPWPYKNGEFTGIVSVEVIEHLENPWHFFREASRVCTDFIIMSTPNPSSAISKDMFIKTGRLKWFTETDVELPLRHITPIFKWQLDKIIKELDLILDLYEYNDPNTQEIQIFRILKRKNNELKYGEVNWEISPVRLRLIWFSGSNHRYLLEDDNKRAWHASNYILEELKSLGIQKENIIIQNPEDHEKYVRTLGYKIYMRDPILKV